MRRNGWSASGVATVAIGWSTKSARSPPNMRRAERFIHSMPRGADGDDAHQHRVEDRARALGLQRHRLLGAVARVDVRHTRR